MSKKCADCGCEVNRNVIQGMYYCPRCDDDKREIDVLPMTLFDRITASPEVLAEELITTTYDEFKDCTVYWAWLGNGRREAYYTKAEAYAATVAKLKKVEG